MVSVRLPPQLSPLFVVAMLLCAAVAGGVLALLMPAPAQPARAPRMQALQMPQPLTRMAAPPAVVDITGRPVANHGTRPVAIARPSAIVIHATGSGQPGSEMNLKRLRRLFDTPSAQVSSHYAVDRKGRIVQYVDDSRRAWHVAAPGWNDISLGIELINDNAGQQYTPQQLDATRRLVQSLGARYGIPVQFVFAHGAIQPWDRRDPVGFPWEAFRRTLVVR